MFIRLKVKVQNKKMIGIVDAELLDKKKRQHFPNLACMKLAGFYKDSELVTDYKDIEKYEKVYISKVFTDTFIPKEVLEKPNVVIGGTGFFFDKAEPLPYEIEHTMPNYNLYQQFFNIDFSLGFLTRGCFRKCKFCVNQKYSQVFKASPLDEFVDPSKKKIILLDDNFLGFKHSEELLEELKNSGKSFVFKQGLDIRLLTEKSCKELFSSRIVGDLIFAFDSIKDYPMIKKKIQLIRKYTNKVPKFYVLVGFERTDLKDIVSMFERINLLKEYKCLPYIMRYHSPTEEPWQKSEWRDLYIAVARYCNQPQFYKKLSFREFCEKDNSTRKKKMAPSLKVLNKFEKKYPKLAKRYFNSKYGECLFDY